MSHFISWAALYFSNAIKFSRCTDGQTFSFMIRDKICISNPQTCDLLQLNWEQGSLTLWLARVLLPKVNRDRLLVAMTRRWQTKKQSLLEGKLVKIPDAFPSPLFLSPYLHEGKEEKWRERHSLYHPHLCICSETLLCREISK